MDQSFSASWMDKAGSLPLKELHSQHVRSLQAGYDRVFAQIKNLDCIVIQNHACTKKYSLDDQDWPKVATPHFTHWTPYQSTPALLILRPQSKAELVCETHQSYWEGAPFDLGMWSRSDFKMSEVKELSKLKIKGRGVVIGDNAGLVEFDEFGFSREELPVVLQALNQLRTTKSAYEIHCMKLATQRALCGHNALQESFLKGARGSELQMHLNYLATTEQTEAETPYGNIVALGRNGAILHHVHYGRSEALAETSLLVDAGATFNGYASDITRTYVRGTSKAGQRFQQLIQHVDRIQQAMAKKVCVGQSYEDLHNESHHMLAEAMLDVKLAKGSSEDLVVTGATRKFFPHGLGHSLGIQVHDVGMKLRPSADENPYLRTTSILAAGHVVTVEPGFYFIEALLNELKSSQASTLIQWDVVDELYPYGGIRIEDNIHCTLNGPENLTRPM
jgi:Xaa-Pro dipeptidase